VHLVDENTELPRHWRRRARVAELAGRPLEVDLVAAAEILSIQADPPVLGVQPAWTFTAFGVDAVARCGMC
jgi:hypothetical protein